MATQPSHHMDALGVQRLRSRKNILQIIPLLGCLCTCLLSRMRQRALELFKGGEGSFGLCLLL